MGMRELAYWGDEYLEELFPYAALEGLANHYNGYEGWLESRAFLARGR